jgi:hypothetical protein
MREWCRRPEFLEMLHELLQGEDEEFAGCIRAIAASEAQRAPLTGRGAAADRR